MILVLNGKLVQDHEAMISAFDHGFLYGVGLFETMRTYKGHPFLLHDHLKRMKNGLDEIGIAVPYSTEKWHELIEQALEANHLQDAYVRLSVTAGRERLGLTGERYQNPTTLIYVNPLMESVLKKSLFVLKTLRSMPETPIRMKTHNFINAVIAKRELPDEPYTEGLFLTKEGWIAEGLVSNLFFIRDGQLYTPAVETGILPGITRQFVLRLAQSIGYQTVEGFFTIEDLMEAEEIFLTNSIQELVPVDRLNHAGRDMFFPKSTKTMQLLHHYSAYTSWLLSVDELRLKWGNTNESAKKVPVNGYSEPHP